MSNLFQYVIFDNNDTSECWESMCYTSNAYEDKEQCEDEARKKCLELQEELECDDECRFQFRVDELLVIKKEV